MRVSIGNATIELVEGDLTKQDTDAIVNAANQSLLGGGGVDGAIHRAGGPEILAQCRRLGGCETGDAKITTGGNLRAKYVIHTVGPVYSDSARDEQLLASCHRRSLELAADYNCRSVAFPAISTGVYAYPLDEAAPIALQTVIDYLKSHDDIVLVRFVLFGSTAFEAFQLALEELR